MSEQAKKNQDELAETLVEKTVEADSQEKSAASPEKKADKVKKAKAKEKKPGIGSRLSRFFRELKAELKKVSWASRQETMKKTGIVIVCVIIVGIIIWVFDSIASSVIDALLSLFGS